MPILSIGDQTPFEFVSTVSSSTLRDPQPPLMSASLFLHEVSDDIEHEKSFTALKTSKTLDECAHWASRVF